MARKHPKISKRAQVILRRLHAGIFYPVYDQKTPKAMTELLDAGLVGSIGRVTRIEACYVPMGTKPFKDVSIPARPKWLR